MSHLIYQRLDYTHTHTALYSSAFLLPRRTLFIFSGALLLNWKCVITNGEGVWLKCMWLGANVMSVKGASLVFLTRWNRDMDTGQLLSERTGWWICCLIVFVMSTSGWDLIGMATYLQTSQMDTLFLCMCECKYSVALTLTLNWLSLGFRWKKSWSEVKRLYN